MDISKGDCFYGGTKDNGVYLLARYELHDEWMFTRVDHGWHVIDTFSFHTHATIKKSELVEGGHWSGWKRIERKDFDVAAKRATNHIFRCARDYKEVDE